MRTFKRIRRFIRTLDKLGLSYEKPMSYELKRSSLYLDIIDKNTEERLFAMRFSDHYLGEHNYLTSGCVLDRCFPETAIRSLKKSLSIYSGMCWGAKAKLWTNRRDKGFGAVVPLKDFCYYK